MRLFLVGRKQKRNRSPSAEKSTIVSIDAFIKGIDVFQERFSLQVLIALAQTCHPLLSLLSTEIACRKLKYHTVYNHPAEVDAMLAEGQTDEHKLRRLLQKRSGEVQGLSGKSNINLTAFQAALCALNLEVCEIFVRFFDKRLNGREIMRRQIFRIFPEGLLQEEQEDGSKTLPHVVAQKNEACQFFNETLVPLITKIEEAEDDEVKKMLEEKQSDSELGQTFEQFRALFEEKNREEAISNLYYLMGASVLYEKHCQRHSWDRRRLFSVQVIGFIQRSLPVHVLQCFVHAFSPSNGRRSLEFKNGCHVSVLEVLPRDSVAGLGFDYSVLDDGMPVDTGWTFRGLPRFEGFVSDQNDELVAFGQEVLTPYRASRL